MKAKIILLVALAALIAVAINLNRQSNPGEEEESAPPAKEATAKAPAPPPAEKKATLEPGRVVKLVTKRGTFKIVLYEKDMPITTKNFVKLVSSGFYNGLTFHRVEPVVVQGGDPKGDGTGGSKETIPLESASGLGYDEPYMVGMARTQDPNSASCQFFVNKQPFPVWNGAYACFGRVFEGQKVIDKIQVGDKMKSVTVAQATPEELAIIKKTQKTK